MRNTIGGVLIGAGIILACNESELFIYNVIGLVMAFAGALILKRD